MKKVVLLGPPGSGKGTHYGKGEPSCLDVGLGNRRAWKHYGSAGTGVVE